MKKVFLTAFLGFSFVLNAQETNNANENAKSEEIIEVVDIAGDEGAEVVEVKAPKTEIQTVTSIVKNSGFLQTVGFDGAWKLDLDLDAKKIILTGGTLLNDAENESSKIRLMVYLAEKPFDLNNPEFIGNVYSVVDLDSLNAKEKESGKTYVTSWASESMPTTGKYYPYILLGEENASTGQFEVRDVKAFEKSLTIS